MSPPGSATRIPSDPAGFMEGVESAKVHVLEGDWSEESGFTALRDWFRIGADRGRGFQTIVCQNDQMARGVARALAERAAEAGDATLLKVPLLGCDGLPQEGQRMVGDGTLAGTVVMPTTSARALELLAAFWNDGRRADIVLLPPESHPPLDGIRPA